MLKSKLKEKININVITTWAVSVLRYGDVGLISCEGRARSEVNNLGWYVKNSLEVRLQGVRATRIIRSEETVSKDEFKPSWNNEKLDSWKKKRLYGQFVREISETTHLEES